MDESTVTATFNCKSCGGKITWPEGIADDFVIRCPTCEIDICNYADLKAITREKAREIAIEEARKAFRKFWP
jgi:DNA-directed RNA polymerase subunit RPC12/RpoP